MVNGKPGDHPLTDVLNHRLNVYGPEIDESIHEIAALSSQRELYEWWERELQGERSDKAIEAKVRQKLVELRLRARESGWETSE